MRVWHCVCRSVNVCDYVWPLVSVDITVFVTAGVIVYLCPSSLCRYEFVWVMMTGCVILCSMSLCVRLRGLSLWVIVCHLSLCKCHCIGVWHYRWAFVTTDSVCVWLDENLYEYVRWKAWLCGTQCVIVGTERLKLLAQVQTVSDRTGLEPRHFGSRVLAFSHQTLLIFPMLWEWKMGTQGSKGFGEDCPWSWTRNL